MEIMKNFKSAQFHIYHKKNDAQIVTCCVKTLSNNLQIVKDKVVGKVSDSIVIFHPMSFPQRG